jgi:hypothetical protein
MIRLDHFEENAVHKLYRKINRSSWRDSDKKTQYHYTDMHEVIRFFDMYEDNVKRVGDRLKDAATHWLLADRIFTFKPNFWKLRFEERTETMTPLKYIYQNNPERYTELSVLTREELFAHSEAHFFVDYFLAHRFSKAIATAWEPRSKKYVEPHELRSFPTKVTRNKIDLSLCNETEFRVIFCDGDNLPEKLRRRLNVRGDSVSYDTVDQNTLVAMAQIVSLIDRPEFKQLIDDLCDIEKDFV